MTNRLTLVAADTRDTLYIGGVPCDWTFTRKAVDLMRGLDDLRFVDMLLDFGSVFPEASGLLVVMSAQLRKMVGRKCRVRAITSTGDGRVEERLLCLDEGSSSLLANEP